MVAAAHGLHKGGILAVHSFKRGHGGGLFQVSGGLGQHYNAFAAAEIFHFGIGDAVAHAAIQIEIAVPLHHFGAQRHGRSRANHIHLAANFQLVAQDILRLAGAHIGYGDIKINGGFFKSSFVKGIQPQGDILIAELGAHHIAGGQQGIQAHKVLITAVFAVIADAAPFLPGYIAAPVQRTGRNPHHNVRHDTGFQENIQHTGGVNAAHGTAFQHKAKALAEWCICCHIFIHLVSS